MTIIIQESHVGKFIGELYYTAAQLKYIQHNEDGVQVVRVVLPVNKQVDVEDIYISARAIDSPHLIPHPSLIVVIPVSVDLEGTEYTGVAAWSDSCKQFILTILKTTHNEKVTTK